MIKIDLEQNSEEWLEFRKLKIGASDAPIVIGISPWKTAYELWQQKTSDLSFDVETLAMTYGKIKEEDIRSWYEKETGDLFTPMVIQSEEHSFMIASLDGISIDRKVILECKTCKEEVFKDAQCGKVPNYYYAQGQHQLACCEAEKVVFVFCHKDSYCKVDVFPDDDYILDLIEKEKEFFQYVIDREEPPLSEKDYVDMTKDEDWNSVEAEAVLAYTEYTITKKRWDDIKKQLLELTDDGNARGGYFKITRCNRAGSIDVKKMSEDGIDVEKYRKKSIGYPKVTPIKRG